MIATTVVKGKVVSVENVPIDRYDTDNTKQTSLGEIYNK